MNETDLTTDEAFLLHRLSTDDGQYGECCGNALDSLMERGLYRQAVQNVKWHPKVGTLDRFPCRSG
jgi:hypothetical protein